MILRPLLAEDRVSIAILDQRCFPMDPWDAASVGQEIGRAGACGQGLLAEGGAWAGYALGWSIAGEAELLRIAVAPEARGQGLGAKLLAAFLLRAQGLGAGAVHLEVRDDNAAAIALYQGAGFALGRRRPGYYRDGCAARLYRFDAAPPSGQLP